MNSEHDTRQAYEDARRAADAHLNMAMDAIAEAARNGEPKPTQFHDEQVRLNERVTTAKAAMEEAMLDKVLRESCPHDPAQWQSGPDTDGRTLTTCPACGVSWYEHPERTIPDGSLRRLKGGKG